MYLHQWVKTVGDHLSIDFVWGTAFYSFHRMRLTCHKCSQTLTCDIPETTEKVDWALQKFVTLHRHDPRVELVKIPETPSPMTVDFKSRVRKPKEGRRFRETN